MERAFLLKSRGSSFLFSSVNTNEWNTIFRLSVSSYVPRWNETICFQSAVSICILGILWRENESYGNAIRRFACYD